MRWPRTAASETKALVLISLANVDSGRAEVHVA